MGQYHHVLHSPNFCVDWGKVRQRRQENSSPSIEKSEQTQTLHTQTLGIFCKQSNLSDSLSKTKERQFLSHNINFFFNIVFFFLLLCFYWLFWFQFCFFYFKLIWFLLVLFAFSCSCGSNLLKGEQTMISDSSPRQFLRLSNLGTAK